MKRRLALSAVMGTVGITAILATATPALADSVSPSDYHVGDICTYTSTCAGSASFVKYGDHLYVWDNKADGHSVVARYYRSDTGYQENTAWNHYGAGTVLDHNMDIPESGWIRYEVCLGEYDGRDILEDTCSGRITEWAS